MKENLFVTFADHNYLEQAKQLFSSVYFNAGWQGDYMLLTNVLNPHESTWFEQRGVIVKMVDPPFSLARYSLFKLFTPDFKKWKHVIYADTDVIVKASLDTLLEITGFAACPDILDHKLRHQFLNGNGRRQKLELTYNLDRLSFNMGFFAFDTDIITHESFHSLEDLFYRYGNMSAFPPQGELNLFFYKDIIRLPEVYNTYPLCYEKYYHIQNKSIKAVVLHFPGADKPWLESNPYYGEWKMNMDRAYAFDAKTPRTNALILDDEEIRRYCRYVLLKKLIHLPCTNFSAFLGFLGMKARLFIQWNT